MALGKPRMSDRQPALWVATGELARSPGNPFYQRLNRVLADAGFDRHCEHVAAEYYAGNVGRPGLLPSRYFRALLIGYFEGISSERGIAWKIADSLSLRAFLGIGLDQDAPDHSTLSKTRKRMSVEAHQKVFQFVLALIAERGLLGGALGLDASVLEANASMKSLEHKVSGESYRDFITGLAKASGIETPTHADLVKLDRKRAGKGSNDDWQNPGDPDARIARRKNGSTGMSYKAEHAVDLNSSAIVAVAIHAADTGDTTSGVQTLSRANENLLETADRMRERGKGTALAMAAVVADKGYHSDKVLGQLEEYGFRSYIAEPRRKRRRWSAEKKHAQAALYANRRRIRGSRGRRLAQRRREKVERSFAHMLESGGMRRMHVRGMSNVDKRYLVQAAACNLGILMRSLFGFGTPRGMASALSRSLVSSLGAIAAMLKHALATFVTIQHMIELFRNTTEQKSNSKQLATAA